jgi:hypothetical protein
MSSSPSIKQFKQRPIARLVSISFLVGCAAVSHSVTAQALPAPFCSSGTIDSSTDVTENAQTVADCTIEDDVTIEQANLVNVSPNALTNEAFVGVYGAGPTASSLVNQGELINNNEIALYADDGGNASLVNNSGARLTNNDEIYSETYGRGSQGQLVNQGVLQNESYIGFTAYDGASNSIVNGPDAALLNSGGLVGEAYGPGSTHTTSNSGILLNGAEMEPDTGSDLPPGPYSGSLLVNAAINGGQSTLLNTESGTLVNSGIIVNLNLADFDGLPRRPGDDIDEPFEGDFPFDDRPPFIDQDSPYTGQATLNNQGRLINQGLIANGSLPIPGPDFSVQRTGNVINNSGTLINQGAIYNGDTINNQGTLVVTDDAIIVNQAYGPEGIARIEPSSDFIEFEGEIPFIAEDSPAIVQTAGELIVNGVIAEGHIDIQGGILGGDGQIFADVTVGADGTVGPGNSPGTLMVAGDLDLFGTLETEIIDETTFDVLEVGGDVFLSDTTQFNVFFDGSYVATDGDSFAFLTAASFDFGFGANSFDLDDLSHFSVTGLQTGFEWAVSFIDNSASIDLDSLFALNVFETDVPNPPSTVSAPATLGLFGLGLSLLGLRARRKYQA